ncbi:hypothetical protein PO909_032504 [Leuciscus waleckii]
MLWLEENVKKVLKRVDTLDPYVEDCQNKQTGSQTFTFPTMRVGRDQGEESNGLGRGTVPGEGKIEGCGASIPGSLQALWGEGHHGTIGKRPNHGK